MPRYTAPLGKRKRSGVLISTALDSDKSITQDTIACVHCGYNWVYSPGSGNIRGFCQRCMGFTCGHPWCDKNGCVCQEAQLENIEAGRDPGYRRIIVATS